MRTNVWLPCLLIPCLIFSACSRDEGEPRGHMVSPTAPDLERFSALLPGENQCPVAENQFIDVDHDSSVNFQLGATDGDGDPLQYAITLAPSHGILVVQIATGQASYAPAAGYCGPDAFQFSASDGSCTSGEGTVIINVICGHCPIAENQLIEVDQNSSVNFLLGATDEDGDPLEYVITQGPAHGIVVVQLQTGQASYAPTAGYSGPDEFKFTASDGSCTSNEGTVSITVHVLDSDGDGVPDGEDDCANSDLRETVWVGTCDTAVLNEIGGQVVNEDGCSLADLVQEAVDSAAGTAANHGKFVRTVEKVIKILVMQGIIDEDQHQDIMSCVAGLPIP